MNDTCNNCAEKMTPIKSYSDEMGTIECVFECKHCGQIETWSYGYWNLDKKGKKVD